MFHLFIILFCSFILFLDVFSLRFNTEFNLSFFIFSLHNTIKYICKGGPIMTKKLILYFDGYKVLLNDYLNLDEFKIL